MLNELLVIGIDFTPAMIEKVRINAEKLGFILSEKYEQVIQIQKSVVSLPRKLSYENKKDYQ